MSKKEKILRKALGVILPLGGLYAAHFIIDDRILAMSIVCLTSVYGTMIAKW